MERDRSYANSVVRACEVLNAFRREDGALSLADLVERTKLSKTTVFRLIQSLIRGGVLARAGKGLYSAQVLPVSRHKFRLGFAAQTDSEFCREVTASLERVAAREQIHLIIVNNRYSPREALRNADLLIREHVDLVLEYQTYERVAPIIASKFLEANIPGRYRTEVGTLDAREEPVNHRTDICFGKQAGSVRRGCNHQIEASRSGKGPEIPISRKESNPVIDTALGD